jgi:hypothetical protein
MPVRVTIANASPRPAELLLLLLLMLLLLLLLLLLQTDPQNTLHFFMTPASYTLSSNTSGLHFDSGRDSPVSMLSSTKTWPETSTQSAGITLEEETAMMSPGTSSL